MKWLWIILGSLAGIAALVAIVGVMLPVKHVASRHARFRKPPAELWPSISPGTSQQTFKQDDVNYEVVDAIPGRRLVTKIADKNLPYGGSWTYEIVPDGSGSVLSITEAGEVYNPIFRFVSKFVMGHTATIDSGLKEIGKKTGEDVKIEDQAAAR
jgi:hypothetical protein